VDLKNFLKSEIKSPKSEIWKVPPWGVGGCLIKKGLLR